MIGGDIMSKFLSVKQVAERYGRSREQVKRWIREGKKFPNAIKTSDKKGWQIPVTDIEDDLCGTKVQKRYSVPSPTPEFDHELRELIILAFQVGTLRTPTEEQINFCLSVDLKQLLEAMLVVRQNWNRIKHFDSYVRDAVTLGWSTRTAPKKVELKKENVQRKQSARKPIRTELLPDWFHKKEEVKPPLTDNELSTENLIKQYELSKILSEMGNKNAKAQLIPLKEELAKRGISVEV
jgi:hypothetical protein